MNLKATTLTYLAIFVAFALETIASVSPYQTAVSARHLRLALRVPLLALCWSTALNRK